MGETGQDAKRDADTAIHGGSVRHKPEKEYVVGDIRKPPLINFVFITIISCFSCVCVRACSPSEVLLFCWLMSCRPTYRRHTLHESPRVFLGVTNIDLPLPILASVNLPLNFATWIFPKQILILYRILTGGIHYRNCPSFCFQGCVSILRFIGLLLNFK